MPVHGSSVAFRGAKRRNFRGAKGNGGRNFRGAKGDGGGKGGVEGEVRKKAEGTGVREALPGPPRRKRCGIADDTLRYRCADRWMWPVVRAVVSSQLGGEIALAAGASSEDGGRGGKNHEAALHAMHCVTGGATASLNPPDGKGTVWCQCRFRFMSLARHAHTRKRIPVRIGCIGTSTSMDERQRPSECGNLLPLSSRPITVDCKSQPAKAGTPTSVALVEESRGVDQSGNKLPHSKVARGRARTLRPPTRPPGGSKREMMPLRKKRRALTKANRLKPGLQLRWLLWKNRGALTKANRLKPGLQLRWLLWKNRRALTKANRLKPGLQLRWLLWKNRGALTKANRLKPGLQLRWLLWKNRGALTKANRLKPGLQLRWLLWKNRGALTKAVTSYRTPKSREAEHARSGCPHDRRGDRSVR